MSDAEYFKAAYERMAARNIDMAANNGRLRLAAQSLLDAYSHVFPVGNPWGDELRERLSARE